MSEFKLTNDEHGRAVLLKDGEVVRNVMSIRVNADSDGAIMHIQQYQPDLDFTVEGRVVSDKYLTSLIDLAEKCKEYIKLYERDRGIVIPDSAKETQKKRDIREELSHSLYDAGYEWEETT